MSYTSTNGMFTYTITNNTSYVIEQVDYDIIQNAFNRWESLVTIDSRFPSSHTITISYVIDTLGTNVLGGASITDVVYVDNNFIYGNVIPNTANITMNNSYLYGLKTSIRNDGFSSYYHVLLHEIGHILGIGSFWYLTGCPKTGYVENGTTKHYYTGTNAFREYKSVFAGFSNDAFLGIPIEDDGGAGTAGVHPEEGPEGGVSADNRYINGIFHPGLDTELMSGWLDGSPVSTPLSRITLGFLEDIGYTVNYNLADVYTMSWLATTNANNLEQTYVQGFLDVSGGNMINRNGNLSVLDGTMDVSGDVTLYSKLSVSGDVSLCSTGGLDARVDICGNLYAQYPDNSIPAAAIDGQVEATPNFAGDVAFAGKIGVGSSTTPAANDAELKVTGDIDFTGLLLNNGVEYVSGATDLSGLSDVIVGGAQFTDSLLIGHSTTGVLNAATNNVGVGSGVFNALTGGDSNVAVGVNALYSNTTGSSNVAAGFQALYSNTTGNYNVANGNGALRNNTGDNNVANGYNTLFNNTGDNNVANGSNALYANLTGSNNVANGNGALRNNTAGSNNIATGGSALFANLTGSHNIGSGYQSLRYNTDGSYNIATGYRALYNTTTGDSNTANGRNAGFVNTTGINNTYIGANADAAAGLVDLSNSTAIGYAAKITASNQIMLGTATETVVAPGQVDICGNLYAQYDTVNPTIPAGAIIGGVGSNEFTGDVTMDDNLSVSGTFEKKAMLPSTIVDEVSVVAYGSQTWAEHGAEIASTHDATGNALNRAAISNDGLFMLRRDAAKLMYRNIETATEVQITATCETYSMNDAGDTVLVAVNTYNFADNHQVWEKQADDTWTNVYTIASTTTATMSYDGTVICSFNGSTTAVKMHKKTNGTWATNGTITLPGTTNGAWAPAINANGTRVLFLILSGYKLWTFENNSANAWAHNSSSTGSYYSQTMNDSGQTTSTAISDDGSYIALGHWNTTLCPTQIVTWPTANNWDTTITKTLNHTSLTRTGKALSFRGSTSTGFTLGVVTQYQGVNSNKTTYYIYASDGNPANLTLKTTESASIVGNNATLTTKENSIVISGGRHRAIVGCELSEKLQVISLPTTQYSYTYLDTLQPAVTVADTHISSALDASFNAQLYGNTITDGTATLTGGALSGGSSVSATSITDGTATLTGGDLSGITSIGAESAAFSATTVSSSITTGALTIGGGVGIAGSLYVGGDLSWNPVKIANDSIPQSAIIGSNHFTGDVSMNNNLEVVEHMTINPNDVSVDVAGIQLLDQSLKFTIPNSMTALKYFCTVHPAMIGDFILASSPTETDKTYYVRTTGTTDPFYIFSATPNGTALNDTAAIGSGLQLTLYKGNTYTFISTNTVGHPFMVGDSHNVTTGIKLESTGDGATTSSTYRDPYPLHVNGMANIENNLNVARTLTVAGPIRQW